MSDTDPRVKLTPTEIIQALTPYTGHFPETALRAAIEQKDEVSTLLVQALEEVAADPKKFAKPDYMLHLFAAYLLAQFRDKRAYEPLCRISAAPAETADNLFGDTSTERLDSILASVYDGNPEPLKRLIESDEVYEFIRGAALEAFVILFHTGQISREEALEYFRSLFQEKLRREPGQVWNSLAGAVGFMPAPELIPEMRKAYEDDLIDPFYASLEDFEREALTPFESKEDWQRDKQTLIDDTISEMEWWGAFDIEDDYPEPEQNDSREEDDWDEDEGFRELLPVTAPGYQPPVTYLRTDPKIGRNDPCPCGSGKKYKKCCLGKPPA